MLRFILFSLLIAHCQLLIGQTVLSFFEEATGGGGNYLLDTYGADGELAYAVRRLSTSYTGDCLEVRRDSDNATQDIGFVGEDIDEAAINSFCAGANCYTPKWYDQSGNGNDAVQTNNNYQPKIYDESTGIVKVNAKAGLDFDGINDFFILASVVVAGNYTEVIVMQRENSGTNFITFSGGDLYTFWWSIGNIFYVSTQGTRYDASDNIYSDTGQYIFYINENENDMYRNNTGIDVSEFSITHTGSMQNYGKRGSSHTANIHQEVILYSSSKSSDRTNIYNNQSAYY